MASVFGKIFVGIYVEIKRSDGTFLASSQTQRDTHARQAHARTHTGTPPLHPAAPEERG